MAKKKTQPVEGRMAVLDVDKAKEILEQHRQAHMKEFAAKLQALLVEYDVMLTARFMLFNQMVDPPIAAMPKPQQ